MTTIEELERLCAESGSIAEVARNIGVTRQCLSERLRRAEVARKVEIPELQRGTWLREKSTGHKWQYFGPSMTPGCVRVATEGGANSMDMSWARLEIANDEKPQENDGFSMDSRPVVLFSLSRGDNPNDPRFKHYIDRALQVREMLDSEPKKIYRADPDSNLRATVRAKAEAKKRAVEKD